MKRVSGQFYNNGFGDFFCGSTEEFFHFNQIKIFVIPNNIVFLDQIFNMLVLASQGFGFDLKAYTRVKNNIQQQEMLDRVGPLRII